MAAAPNARKAGWAARISQAAPAALLAAVLGFFAWLAITLVNINEQVARLDERSVALEARVTALEVGQQRLEKRMDDLHSRVDDLHSRVDDLYSRMDDIYKLLAERLPPPENPRRR